MKILVSRLSQKERNAKSKKTNKGGDNGILWYDRQYSLLFSFRNWETVKRYHGLLKQTKTELPLHKTFPKTRLLHGSEVTPISNLFLSHTQSRVFEGKDEYFKMHKTLSLPHLY